MKRANEDDEIEVKEEEIKTESEQPALNQDVENSDQQLCIVEVTNHEDTEVRPVNPPKRRRKNDKDVEIRLLISTRMAGAIIGKSGQNIKKLRSDYDAKINIVDCKGPERVLTIVSSLDVCYKIIRDSLKYCEQSKMNEYDLRLLVHQSLAGCIIGKSGTRIKDLKSKFGCHIKVFPNVAPQSFERVVQIIGNEDKCIKCFTDIMELMSTNNIRGPTRFYDPHNFDDQFANEYGGFGTGSNGNLQNGSALFKRYFSDDNNNNNNNNSNRSSNNNKSSRGKFNERRGDNRQKNVINKTNFVEPWASKSSGNNQIPQMNNFSSNDISNDYTGFNCFMDRAPEEISTQVTIPIHLAGACIGKGGCRIRSIRNESKASIKIDQPLPGSTDRIITITGTPKQIQAAQFLLQQSVQRGIN